jgi:hypothetical protein
LNQNKLESSTFVICPKLYQQITKNDFGIPLQLLVESLNDGKQNCDSLTRKCLSVDKEESVLRMREHDSDFGA